VAGFGGSQPGELFGQDTDAVLAAIQAALRDAQAAWLRDQELITADSVVSVVQLARGSITHAGAPLARALLDDLQQQAATHPEGVPGYLVANARMKFDELMRRNIQ
jgi:hypothetical protein